MRILLLENVSEIGLPQSEPPNPGPDVTTPNLPVPAPQVYHWKVAGINSWSTSEHIHLHKYKPCFNASKLQLLLQDVRTFALLDAATLQLHPLDATSAIAEDCAAISVSTDGKLVFGLQWSEEFVVLCSPEQDVKHIRSGYGMTLGRGPSIYRRIVSRFRGLFGSPSGFNLSEMELKMDAIDTLFPLLAPSKDGLALLCFFKPGEGFLFTCNYSAALRHKHISNIAGSKVPGRWWRIRMDENIVLSWAKGKGVPSVETQLAFLDNENETRSVQGVIIYSIFVNRRLEILYGLLAKPDDHYELKWGLLKFEMDLVVSDALKPSGTTSWSEDTPITDEKPHFVIKANSQGDKVAIAVNTHAGVYLYIQSLPGTDLEVKLERVTVPLCSHCDYGNAIYYDKECWISCIEWVAEDCYLAVATRCGCLCFFHKTGEPMITKVVDRGRLVKERCDFYTPIFHGRGPNTPLKISEGLSETKSMKEIDLKWCGPGTNVLTVSNGSKVYVHRILRVSNYVELSDMKIPSALSLSKSITSEDIKNRNKGKEGDCRDRPSAARYDHLGKNEGVGSQSEMFNAGEQIFSTINAFVKELPQAEIILRPVVVQTSSTDNQAQQRNFPVQFNFGNNKGIMAEDSESRKEVEVQQVETHQAELPQGLDGLQMDFELAKRNGAPKSYYADDEMTEQSDGKPELYGEVRPESSKRSHLTATDTESFNAEQSDIESVIDSTYSPPFTEDEDANESPKSIKPCRQTKEPLPQFLRLTLPQSPKIEAIIPFAPMNLTDDLTVVERKIPSRPYSRSMSPNRTGVLEDTSGGKSVCIITDIPPKTHERKFCIMSPMVRLHIPSESDSPEESHDIREMQQGNDETSNKSKEVVNDEELNFAQLDEAFELEVENNNTLDNFQKERKSSRAIWEEVSGMFSNMKPMNRNPKRCKPNPAKQPLRKVNSKPKTSIEFQIKSQTGPPYPIQTQTSLEQLFGKVKPSTRESKDDMLNYMNKLLSTTRSTTKNKNRWNNQSKRPRTTPTLDETSDDELHRQLKQKLGMGLTIYSEVMENVKLHPNNKTVIKKIGKPLVKSPPNGGESPDADDDNRKVQRRVSFSDPIAVFKTMSQENLVKEGEWDQSSAEDEMDETPSYQLRRMYTQLFDP